MRSIAVMSALRSQMFLKYRRLSSLATDLSPDLMSGYESVIGLEVHTQITSKSKLFSRSGTAYTSPPNTQVSYFDCALPGTLPVLNRKCVESALATGLSLNCHIPKRSAFDRKHYFYADMPAGYQITQQRHPLAINGFIDFIVLKHDNPSEAYIKRSQLKQIQLEQDSGKSLQDDDNHIALVDLNRAGVALMEFVFEPDLKDAKEAVALVKELVLILKSIETSTCKMQEGVLRVDANISVHKPGQPFGVRTEVKNLNSFRFIHSAIEYEIKRLIQLLESGGEVVNETRRYDQRLKETVPMRDKEVVQDYRFMPEPNIPPILLCDGNDSNQQNLINISQIKKRIDSIEKPNQLREKLIKNYCLSLSQVFVLMNDNKMTSLFFKVCQNSQTKRFEVIFNFLNSELKNIFDDLEIDFDLCPIDPKILSQITDLLSDNQISNRIAYQLIKLYLKNEKRTPNQIITENDWTLITDKELIENKCLLTIENYGKLWRKYSEKGVKKSRSALIENVMKQLNNRVNESDIWEQYDRLVAKTNTKTTD